MDKVKYVVTGTPHIRSDETVSSIMLDVIVALSPATVVACYLFGFKAIFLILSAVLSSVAFEFLFQKGTKRIVTINDLSSVVTGLLIAFNIPVSAPIWLPIVGSFFAIIIAKQLFGGLGQNFINPALAARAFLLASYPSEMTNWSTSALAVDTVTSATPLVNLKEGIIPTSDDFVKALLGTTGGSLGETCALALILGGLYLIARKVITWHIPVFYIGTVAILSLLFGRSGGFVYEIITGGLLLGAFFMATDYSSSPVTPKGKIIFAIGCGLITTVIRAFSQSYPEGVSYSILLMNLFVPLIDRFTHPKIYGEVKK